MFIAILLVLGLMACMCSYLVGIYSGANLLWPTKELHAIKQELLYVVHSSRARELSGDHVALVDAKAHLKESVTSSDLPDLGDRWGAYAKRLRRRLPSIRSAKQLLEIGQAPLAGVETHLPPSELAAFCQLLDLELLAMNPSPELYNALPSFHAPPLTTEDWVVEHRGTKFDVTTMAAAYTILMISHWLRPDKPRSICDIGGGTGKYAHAWLTNSAVRPELVVILDLPETLIYSETLLRSSLGSSSVQYISRPTDIPRTSGVVLCPISNYRAIESLPFDIVTNVGSMQEMPDDWIDWYMSWLDRQPCRYFFSHNYFATALTSMWEGHNSWSPRPSARWQLVQSKLGLSMRTSATMLYQKDPGCDVQRHWERPVGAEQWLSLLEAARLRGDESSYRQALAFALTQLPFIPKESWQVARTLAEITNNRDDAKAFAQLDALRKEGHEAAH